MTYLQSPFYLIAVAAFVIALIRMGSPKTARSGILWAGIAMVLAVAVTFTVNGLSNIPLILVGIAAGGGLGWIAAIRVAVSDMPQMVAIYNGMGAGAAAAVASVELLRFTSAAPYMVLAMAGATIGSVSIAGSIIAFLKLQGWIGQKPLTFPGQQVVNIAVLATAALLGALYLLNFRWAIDPAVTLALFFAVASAYGILLALPIGGADMPVIIALFNALTGLAVAFDGFSISNYAMIVAGLLVGAAGTILTLAMAKAMNRSLPNVLFGSFGASVESLQSSEGSLKPIEAADAAVMLAYASRVMIVPGFGMAAAQAQFRLKDLLEVLSARGVSVEFAIHPVAGRMPGHMNVLLAEAGVPYELFLDLEEANRKFPSSDVALVVGANDVVNPAARSEGSPLHGMPILNADESRNVIVLKRGKGKGFSGITNQLFTEPKTRMLYGDASDSLTHLVQEVKKV